MGGPLIFICGFNRHLGWANIFFNDTATTEIYTLDRDPAAPDHYLLDGASLPIARESLTVKFKDGESVSSETREFLSTPLGPVIHARNDQIFIARTSETASSAPASSSCA